jgi:hypothetical protein
MAVALKMLVCLAVAWLAEGVTTPPSHVDLEEVVDQLTQRVNQLEAELSALQGTH